MEARGPDGAATRKTAALPGFVSTAVLTSSDGLFGDNVEETRISDAPAERAHDAADYKPLYDRLQEMKDQKDKEWKEKNNPFAPPKALDDEEIEFIRDLESRRADSEKHRKAQQDDDRVEFLLARESAKQQHAKPITNTTIAPGTAKPTPLPATKPSAPSVAIKAKRKPQATQGPSGADNKKKKKKTESTVTVVSTSMLGGLVGYGSDSDSDHAER